MFDAKVASSGSFTLFLPGPERKSVDEVQRDGALAKFHLVRRKV
jgi:hypothetical protein